MDKGHRYVIGDIHGCINSFRKLVEDGIRLKMEDTLFLLGDYVDRGPDPKGVIDYIMELQHKGFRVNPIMGNHEYMMLHASDSEEDFGLWSINGHAPTLISFGIDPSRVGTMASVFDIPKKYLKFISGLPLSAATEGFLLVHAGIAKDSREPLEDAQILLWTREEINHRKLLKNRRLIHGHTPMSLVSIRDRVYDPEEKFINLDGGCVFRNYKGFGNLVALNLDTLDILVQENID